MSTSGIGLTFDPRQPISDALRPTEGDDPTIFTRVAGSVHDNGQKTTSGEFGSASGAVRFSITENIEGYAGLSTSLDNTTKIDDGEIFAGARTASIPDDDSNFGYYAEAEGAIQLAKEPVFIFADEKNAMHAEAEIGGIINVSNLTNLDIENPIYMTAGLKGRTSNGRLRDSFAGLTDSDLTFTTSVQSQLSDKVQVGIGYDKVIGRSAAEDVGFTPDISSRPSTVTLSVDYKPSENDQIRFDYQIIDTDQPQGSGPGVQPQTTFAAPSLTWTHKF